MIRPGFAQGYAGQAGHAHFASSRRRLFFLSRSKIKNPQSSFIKIHLHFRKLTFHYYKDFDTTPPPELLTRIKIDLKRLFVSVIDHTTGPEHQLLFFKERFLAMDHPARPKMDRFSAMLRKLGLREETIGYGPTKEKWEAWNRDR